MVGKMRIGVYVDAFNLYYGGRGLCGRGSAGWRWLDIRAMAESLVTARKNWPGATVDRVVYCTARVDGSDNPSAQRDQDMYLKALVASRSVDYIEYGHYVSRVKYARLAVRAPGGRPSRPLYWQSDWPLQVCGPAGDLVPGGGLVASYMYREEKGSDVNVAAHLMNDVWERRVDGAVVLSNDSDLRLPIQMARQRVPLGLVSPNTSPVAGALRGVTTEGVGRHWWAKLTADDFRSNQMPPVVGRYARPPGW
jgi:hypothetical protein